MRYELRLSLLVVLVCGAVIFGVSLMPALTSGGGGPSSAISQAEFEATVSRERDFCEQQPEAIDCACFAQKSGMIQSHVAPQVPTALYADKRDLARGQAAQSC